MKRNIRLVELSLFVMAALALSAFSTMTARADDGTLPPTATPAAAQSADAATAAATPAATAAPADTSATQEAATAATEAATAAAANQEAATAAPADATAAAPTEATAATPEPATTEAATAAAATEEAATAAPADATAAAPTEAATPAPEAAAAQAGAPLSQIPDRTDVVLLDNAGNPVDTGSPEAADIIAHGDPIWCPTGVAPKPLTNNCTDSFSLFNGGFITALNNKTVSGTIWISNTYTGEGSSVTLDGTLGTTASYALTLQGGWNGIAGSTVITTTPSIFNAPLIINWNADVTINNITVTGDAGSATELGVTTPKNITLTNVSVTNNSGPGAVLDNTAGTGNITVTNGNFAKNSGGAGLAASSKGTITISGIKADGNGGDGAKLDNSTASASAPKTVTIITGADEFNGNGDKGLEILSRGAISLKDIDALNNTGDGVFLDNTYNAAPQAITLTGSNVLSVNGNDGLEVHSKGPITANNLVDNANLNWGAYLDNSTSTLAQAVTLTGSSNQFKDNLAGLFILSKGNISLNSITASDNAGDPGNGLPSGALLDNCAYFGSACSGTGNIALTGTNVFDNNYRTGLQALSTGTITINNLSADGNGWDLVTPANSGGSGAVLDNTNAALPKAITLTGANNFHDNHDDGLDAFSHGAIAASSITAAGNTWGNGADIDNSGAAAAQPVTITGLNTFNGSLMDGLLVYSRGAITISSITANGDWIGADIENTAASGPQPITITGVNSFNGYGFGLMVYSKGAITVSNITASGNCGGAELDNHTAAAAQPITLTGVNTFNNNTAGDGLEIYSNGAVTVSNISASGNSLGYGVRINNSTSAAAQPVTISGTNVFSNNGSDGLNVSSNGAVSLSSATANGNGLNHDDPTPGTGIYTGYGVIIINTNSLTPVAHQGVTVSGTNQFKNNWFDGLMIVSFGPISVSNVTANGNGLGTYSGYGEGAYLDTCLGVGSCADTAAEPITVTGTNQFNSNSGFGLIVTATGAVTLNNIDAETNGANGAYIDNSLASAAQAVSLAGTNSFIGNGLNGLRITSKGAVSTSNMTAKNNGGEGADIDNSYASTALPVTLAGTNSFITNGETGLNVLSKGVITAGALSANGNNNNGAYLDNCNWDVDNNKCFGAGAVTITGVLSFNDNSANGLTVYSNGAITVSPITANGNGGNGAYLNDCESVGDPDNHYCTGSGNITLTGVNTFNNNGWNNPGDGLDAYSKGAIALSAITASGNSGGGAFVDNRGWIGDVDASHHTGTAGITLTGVNILSGNTGGDGLDMLSNGPITVSALTANGNNVDGAYFDNCDWDGVNYKCFGAGAVTITGVLSFNDNSATGLSVYSNGAITVSPITANGNGGKGAYLNNCEWTGDNDNHYCTGSGNITLTGVNTFNNNGWNVSGDGLDAYSKGAIALSAITASGNSGGGAYVENRGWIGTVDPSHHTGTAGITMTGVNTFNNNAGWDGLAVVSYGPITVSALTAGGNAGDGAYLDDQWDTGTPGGVTLTGSNSFLANSGLGLETYSNNAISISNITASNNLGGGLFASTYGLFAPQSVTLTGANIFLSNGDPITYGGDGNRVDGDPNTGDGLDVNATGNITINNLTANGNYGGGAQLDNCRQDSGDCTGTGTITLTGANSVSGSYNADGLDAYSHGAIAVSNLTANGNLGAGANLVNNWTGATGTIILSGTNTLSGNGGDGLTGYSNGAISLNNITASNNGGYGVNVANEGSAAPQPVSVSGTNIFNTNGSDGLHVYTQGAVTLNNVTANDNGTTTTDPGSVPSPIGYGATIYNAITKTSHMAVTLTGTSQFNSNWLGGLYVGSYGVITASGITANGDGQGGFYSYGNGALLDNCMYDSGACTNAAAEPVTVTGALQFNGNSETGLAVFSSGAITTGNVAAAGNYNGAYLDNSGAALAQPITLSGANTFTGNGNMGIEADSKGAITINTLTASGNGSNGAFLNNLPGTSAHPQNVTLTGTNAMDGNGNAGLSVTTFGTIAINNLDASGNGTNLYGYGWGAYLDACSFDNVLLYVCTSPLAKSITLTGTSTFNGNEMDGLWAIAKGPISIGGMTADENGQDGANLNNQWGTGSVGGITLTGSNTFKNNGRTGLLTNSNGSIAVNSVTADYNIGSGMAAAAIGLLNAPQTVTMTGTNTFLFNGDTIINVGDGLDVWATGNITINNLTASNNAGAGANLDNCLYEGDPLNKCTATGSITLTGVNTFYNNFSTGVELASHQNVTVNSLTADKNGEDGIYAVTDGAIVVLGGSLTRNGGYGWELGAGTTVTLKGVFATANSGGNTNLIHGTLTIVRTYP